MHSKQTKLHSIHGIYEHCPMSNDIIAISTSHKHKSLMWRCKDSLTVYQTSFARVSHSFISFCYSFNSMTYILRSGFTSEEIHFMILWPFQTILSLDRGVLREELRKRCWYRLKLMVIAIDHFDMIFKHIISSYLLIVDRMEMIFKSLRECYAWALVGHLSLSGLRFLCSFLQICLMFGYHVLASYD